MGFRYRKSINLGGGVHLNLSKSGVGASVGVRGFRHTLSPRGYTRTTTSLPGTGLSYVRQRSLKAGRSGGGDEGHAFAPALYEPPPDLYEPRPSKPDPPPHPGLFASKVERRFAEGSEKVRSGDFTGALASFKQAVAADAKGKTLADDFVVGVIHSRLGQYQEAIPSLETVVQSEQPLDDRLLNRYLSDLEVEIACGDVFVASLRPDAVAATFLLAECYEHRGRHDEAIGLMQRLYDAHPVDTLLVGLCEMHAKAEEWSDVVDALRDKDFAGVEGENDLGEHDLGFMLQGLQSAALEATGEREQGFEAMERFLRTRVDQALDPQVDLIALLTWQASFEKWDGMIALIAEREVTNIDDGTFRMKLLQAQALEAKGLNEAALEVYRDCLSFKPREEIAMPTRAQSAAALRRRDPELLREARYRRGRLYLKMGKHKQATTDLSRVYAEDPDYKDVARILEP